MSYDSENDMDRLKENKRLAQRIHEANDLERQKLQHIIASSNLGTFEWNIQTGEFNCNERFAEIIGYTLEELQPIMTGTWYQNIHPEDGEKSKEALRSHFAKETEYYDSETRFRHKKGHWIWVRFRGKVVTWTVDGKPLLMYGTFFDSTERKRVQEALIENEKRFNLALESANIGLFDWNMSDDTTYFSPQWKKLLGYEEHELVNVYDTWKSRWHPDDAAKIQQAMEDYLQGKTTNYQVTYRIRHKNGEWRWFLSRGETLKDPSGKPYRWIGTFIDVTDLVKERQENEELERFFAFTPDLMLIANSENEFLKFNEAWQGILGYSSEELLKHKFLELLHPDDIEPTLAAIATVEKKGGISSFVNRYRYADGTFRYIEWFARIYEGLIYSSGRDVTAKREFEEKEREYQRELREKNRLIETILSNAPIGIWLSGETTGSIFTNTFFQENFNMTPEEIAVCQGTDNDARSKGGTQHYEEVVTFKDGKKHILETVKTKIAGADDSMTSILGIGLDLTKLKEDEEALRVSEAKLRILNENMTDVIWTLNLDQKRFTFVSKSIEQLLGFTREEFSEKTLGEFIMPEYQAGAMKQIEEAVQYLQENPTSTYAFRQEQQHRSKKGDPIWVEISANCRLNAQKEIEAVGTTRNIEERKKAEQEILFLSRHDRLTKLFNRHYFDDKVAEEITRGDRYQVKLALISLDLDHFKKVNDTWGHAVGDEVLQQAAELVRSMVRKNDTVARMGGEEFLILLPETTEEGARVVAEKIRVAMEGKVYPQAGRITASFGVAERQGAESYTSWVKRSDDALYQSKHRGRNRVTSASDLEKGPTH